MIEEFDFPLPEGRKLSNWEKGLIIETCQARVIKMFVKELKSASEEDATARALGRSLQGLLDAAELTMRDKLDELEL